MVRNINDQVRIVYEDVETAVKTAIEENEKAQKITFSLERVRGATEKVITEGNQLLASAQDAESALTQIAAGTVQIAKGAEEASQAAQSAATQAQEQLKAISQIAEATQEIANLAEELKNV